MKNPNSIHSIPFFLDPYKSQYPVQLYSYELIIESSTHTC